MDSGAAEGAGPAGRPAGAGGLLSVLVVLLALSGVALPSSRGIPWGAGGGRGASPPAVVQPGRAEVGRQPPVSCARARALVTGAHPALFALLRPRGLRVTCGARPLPGGERLVSVSWLGRRAVHQALYRVTPDWVVRPGDATARLLEELADYGPLAQPVLEEG